jgi:signal transduction histidine kinase
MPYFLDTISRFSAIIQSKKINVSTNFSAEHYIETDGYLFSIVINNLISNALKYSNQYGNLLIVLKEIDSIIECHISDTGMGLQPKILTKSLINFTDPNRIVILKLRDWLGLSIVKIVYFSTLMCNCQSRNKELLLF